MCCFPLNIIIDFSICPTAEQVTTKVTLFSLFLCLSLVVHGHRSWQWFVASAYQKYQCLKVDNEMLWKFVAFRALTSWMNCFHFLPKSVGNFCWIDVVCRRDSEWQFKNFCNHPSDAQNCGFWRLDQCQCFPLDSFKLHWQPLIPSFQYPLKKQIFNVIAIRQWSSRMCSLSNMLLFIVLAFPSIFRLQLQSLPGM